MDKIHLAFDATATPDQLTGAGYYVKEILHGLDAHEGISLSIVTRRNDGQRFSDYAPGAKILDIAPTNKAARIAFQAFKLGQLVDSLNADVFHGPHYQLPEKMNTPSVVTIHDMTLLTHRDVHVFAKSLFFSQVIPRSAKHAKSIITVSQHTSHDVEKLIEGHGKIFVAPLGIDVDRFHSEVAINDEKILAGRGIQKPYIAFLGTFEPRKSIPTLVKAFAYISDEFPELRLVLAGGKGWGANEIRAAIVESGVATRIVTPGRLENDEIAPFLRNAEAFVYPSIYEGFGMPVAEAMACGTPTITTDSSSMKEVAGEGALLIKPGDELDLSGALKLLLNNKTFHSKMSAKAIERAKAFSWDTCVDVHVDAYKFAVK
ncbi:MAG TPA: glycosyltransferase family 1 protein [Acidimicrobiia bacterium]|nr:glycosyltransferase family 1 protein [Acidimicrobiia bacterium]